MEFDYVYMIAIDKTMYENQFDLYVQIEYAKKKNIEICGKKDFFSFILQLVELDSKIKDHNQTIDIEFH